MRRQACRAWAAMDQGAEDAAPSSRGPVLPAEVLPVSRLHRRSRAPLGMASLGWPRLFVGRRRYFNAAAWGPDHGSDSFGASTCATNRP